MNYVRVKSKLKVARCVAVIINHCLCFPFVGGKLSASGNCLQSRGDLSERHVVSGETQSNVKHLYQGRLATPTCGEDNLLLVCPNSG